MPISVSVSVTPLAGVWIEILIIQKAKNTFFVTPLAGVWIEIITTVSSVKLHRVTPLAGVWIEIKKGLKNC